MEAQRYMGPHTMIPAPTMVTSAVRCADPEVDEKSLAAPRIIIIVRATPLDDSPCQQRSTPLGAASTSNHDLDHFKTMGWVTQVAVGFALVTSLVCASASDYKLNEPWECKNENGRKGERMKMRTHQSPTQNMGSPACRWRGTSCPLLLNCFVMDDPRR